MNIKRLRELQESLEVYGELEEAYKKLPKEKINKKIASKGVKAAKHYFSSTWGSKDKSEENLETANKLASQVKKNGTNFN